jgi:hypothetical protein
VEGEINKGFQDSGFELEPPRPLGEGKVRAPIDYLSSYPFDKFRAGSSPARDCVTISKSRVVIPDECDGS